VFVVLFALSGLGNGATYAMIPLPYAAAERAIAEGADAGSERLAARRKAGAVIAIAGTFGGLGGVAINLAFRESYASAHNARPALLGCLVFYAVCVAVTAYARRRVQAGAPSRVPAVFARGGAPPTPPVTRRERPRDGHGDALARTVPCSAA
jgi:NNP family nitrate/nitrite transporter-like MFS transporter